MVLVQAAASKQMVRLGGGCLEKKLPPALRIEQDLRPIP